MSLFLFSCRALASPTTCRFIPAHSGRPTTHELKVRVVGPTRRTPWCEIEPATKLPLRYDSCHSLRSQTNFEGDTQWKLILGAILLA